MKDITEKQHHGTIQPPILSRKCRNPNGMPLGRVRNRPWFPQLVRLTAKHTPSCACRCYRCAEVENCPHLVSHPYTNPSQAVRLKPALAGLLLCAEQNKNKRASVVLAPVCVWIRPPLLPCVLRGVGARVVSAIAASGVCSNRHLRCPCRRRTRKIGPADAERGVGAGAA